MPGARRGDGGRQTAYGCLSASCAPHICIVKTKPEQTPCAGGVVGEPQPKARGGAGHWKHLVAVGVADLAGDTVNGRKRVCLCWSAVWRQQVVHRTLALLHDAKLLEPLHGAWQSEIERLELRHRGERLRVCEVLVVWELAIEIKDG